MQKDYCQLTCNKGGQHKGEGIKIVCLNPGCRNENLGCIICKRTLHNKHDTISLKQFYDTLEQRLKSSNPLKGYPIKQSDKESFEEVCLNNFKQFKQYISYKLQKLEDKINAYFQQSKSISSNSGNCSILDKISLVDLKREQNVNQLKAQISLILNNSIVRDGQIKSINILKSQIQPLTNSKESSNAYMDNEFTQQVMQSMQLIHSIFSDEYKKIYEYVHPTNTSTIINTSFFNANTQNYLSYNQNNPSFANTGNNNNPFRYSQNFGGIINGNNSNFIGNNYTSNYNSNYASTLFNNNNNNNNNNQQCNQILNTPESNDNYESYKGSEHHQRALSAFSQYKNCPEKKNRIPQFEPRIQQLYQLQQLQPSQPVHQPQPPFIQQYQRYIERSNSGKKKDHFSIVDYDAKCLQDRKVIPQVNNFELQFFDKGDFNEKKLAVTTSTKHSYRFSLTMKHPKIVLDEAQLRCTTVPNSKKVKLVLLESSIEMLPLQETTFSMKITSCKNLQYSAPLAVGLCHQKIAEINNYEFEEENIKDPSLAQSLDSFKSAYSRSVSFSREGADHGCYLLSSTGIVRNTYDKKQDMRKAKVRFNTGDIINCLFNPFKRFIEFKRKGTTEKCILNINMKKGDKLYICVRLGYTDDVVEIIQ